MEAGLEHFDMGLVNYRQHPTNVNYMVYRFKDENRAASFEAGLQKAGLWYERNDPDEDDKKLVLFAVEKKHFDKTQKINFRVEAKHKKFLIPNTAIRWFFVLLMGGIIALGIIGYRHKMQILERENQQLAE